MNNFFKYNNHFGFLNSFIINSNEDYLIQIKFIEGYKLNYKIEYLRHLYIDKKPSSLINSDCLVLVWPDFILAQFGFPTKLGDYLATKHPVIVTSVGEIPAYFENNVNAFIASLESVEDFTLKILNALKNRVNAKVVGKKGVKLHMNILTLIPNQEK